MENKKIVLIGAIWILIIFALVFISSLIHNPQNKITWNENYKNNNNNFLINPKSEKDLIKLKTFSENNYYTISSESSTLKSFDGINKGYSLENSAEKYTQTNVQVKGIDEADIIKTDGEHLFLSNNRKTYDFKAYPPQKLKLLKELNKSGLIYLTKDKLILIENNHYIYPRFGNNKIDIYDKKNLNLIKEINLNGSYVDSRLINNTLILILRKNQLITKPLFWNGIKIGYNKYFIPIYPISKPDTYLIIKYDLNKLKVEDAISIVGSYDQNIYVSHNKIYFAYDFKVSDTKIICNFIRENKKLFENIIDIDKVERICENKDFSDYSKQYELRKMIYSTRNNSFISKFNKMLQKYIIENKEKIFKTGIVSIEYKDGLKIKNQIIVPGEIINQFSMDEYNGYLRVATTYKDWKIRNNFSSNVYIIKGNKIIGKLENIEPGERIYAARFIKDKLYLVTYKQMDPFFVIDLSDPKNPKILGYIKIPGFSTYIYPINKTMLLAIGKDENGKVKLALYDVSDFKNPKELDKYVFDEYWSKALYDHHYFIYDRGYVLIPANKKLYVFKIENKKIKMLISPEYECNVLRGLFFDDYLYIITNNLIEIRKLDNLREVINKLKYNKNCNYIVLW